MKIADSTEFYNVGITLSRYLMSSFNVDNFQQYLQFRMSGEAAKHCLLLWNQTIFSETNKIGSDGTRSDLGGRIVSASVELIKGKNLLLSQHAKLKGMNMK